MAKSPRPPRNNFVRQARKIYNPLGFSKGYNFILFVLFDGGFFAFILSRFEYLNYNGVFCNPTQGNGADRAIPGECWTYATTPRTKIGIILHLATIIPASFLAVFQFIPIIRYKAILYHRMAGYVAIVLALASHAAALMIADHTFGGDFSIQGWIGTMVILTTIGMGIAYYNIKRLQIDQHRAWMLRSWAWFATIITLRIIMFTAAAVSARWKASTRYLTFPCDQIIGIFGGATQPVYALYPACNPDNRTYATDGFVAVKTDYFSSDPTQLAASFYSLFGMSGWIALVLHTIGVELYLKLTPRESERLRQVSYERQMERGMKNAGHAGLVVENFGDADPWVPKAKVVEMEGGNGKDIEEDEVRH